MNKYYETSLKVNRLAYLEKVASKLKSNWHFYKVDLKDKSKLFEIAEI